MSISAIQVAKNFESESKKIAPIGSLPSDVETFWKNVANNQPNPTSETSAAIKEETQPIYGGFGLIIAVNVVLSSVAIVNFVRKK